MNSAVLAVENVNEYTVVKAAVGCLGNAVGASRTPQICQLGLTGCMLCGGHKGRILYATK